MGCWNGSCAVSGMSIKHGMKVVALPILCKDGIWSFCSLPIYGVYNDYGSLEEIEETEYTEWLVKYFKENSGVSPNHEDTVGYDGRDVEATTPESKIWLGRDVEYALGDDKTTPETISDVINLLEREIVRGDVVKIRLWNGEWGRMSMMLVERNTYDLMTQFESEEDKSWRKYRAKKHPEEIISKDDIKNNIVKLINDINESKLEWKRSIETPTSLLMDTFRIEDDLREYMESHLRLGDSMESFDPVMFNPKIYIKQCKNAGDFVTEVMNFRNFIYNMSCMRKHIGPTLGAGSQHDNLKDVIKINREIAKIVRERLKWEKENW